MATAQPRSEEDERTEEVDARPPSLWRNLDYMYWWTGNGVSTLGTSVSTLAFPLLMLSATGSVAQAGAITACHMIGTLVMLPVGGVLADRVSRRALMVSASLGQALAMAAVALLVYRGDPVILLLDLLALAGGLAAGLRSGVSMSALRRIVPKEQVPTATAQGMGRDMVAHLLGAPLGGLLYSLSRWMPFLFDALSFLFVTLASALIRRPLGPDRYTGEGPRPGLFTEMADGLRMVRGSRYLVFTIVWGALLNVVAEGFTLLFVVLVQHRGGSPTDVGTATSLALVGGLLGATAGPALMRRMGARRVMLVAAWLFVACFAAVVWVPRPWQIGLVLLVAMTSMVPLNVVIESYQVRLVPDAYLGRLAAVVRFSIQAVQWTGPLGAGFLADALGVRHAVLVLAVCMAALALALHVARRRLSILDIPLAEVREIDPPGVPAPAPVVDTAANDRSKEDSSGEDERRAEAGCGRVDDMTEHSGHHDQNKQMEPAKARGSELLASDDDRNRVAEKVRAAVAAGRLEIDDLDARLAQVYQARTHGELDVAGRGLPDIGPRDALVVDRAPTSRFALGMFGGFERQGEWVVPPRFTAWSMWGGGRLDLSEARYAKQETVIRAVALFGGTEIILPDDIEVEVRGFGLFGVFGKRGARKHNKPGTPRVLIKGLAMFGGVVTKTREMNRSIDK
ncbi:MFS transporter [Streptomyces sp. NPDC085466]|uniref:MFS transporter n=1 Tax=Streptomyces sp. NPDC085466 TaxID=3365725 RepID=UPI0037CE091C